MPNDEYRPRISFDISDEQRIRADNLIATYGIRKTIFNIILDDLLDLIEEHGSIVIGVLVSGKLKPRAMIPIMNKAERLAKGVNDGES